MNIEWYMTEEQFLETVTNAYRHRWNRGDLYDRPMHPTDHTVNFMAFLEAFSASLEAMSDFVEDRPIPDE